MSFMNNDGYNSIDNDSLSDGEEKDEMDLHDDDAEAEV